MVASVRRCAIIFLMALGPVPAWAQSPTIPKLVVVPVKSKGAPNLAGSARLLEKALAGHADIERFKPFEKAARKARVKPKDLATPAGAAKVAAELGLSHVLLLAGATERGEGKKKKPVHSAVLTLISVPSGETVWSGTFALKGKKITKDVAEQMVQQVAAKLAPAPAVPEPEPEPEATSEAPTAEGAPPPPPPPPAGDGSTSGEQQAAADESTEAAAQAGEGAIEASSAQADAAQATGETASAAGAPQADGGAESSAEMPTDATVGSAEPEPEPAADAAGEASSPAVGEPAAAEPVSRVAASPSAPRQRAVLARVGGFGFLRRAVVSEKGSGDKLTYGGDQPLGAAMVQAAAYPLALTGRSDWLAGLGVVGEALFTQVRTEVQQSPSVTVTSNVVDAWGALALRLAVGPAQLEPRLGYSYFQFPLQKSAFPGVSYHGPLLGLGAALPIVEQVAIIAAGELAYLGVGDKAAKLGKLKSALRLGGTLGVRVTLAPLVLELSGRYGEINAQFGGVSTLSTSSPFTDATLRDRLFGAQLSAGVTL